MKIKFIQSQRKEKMSDILINFERGIEPKKSMDIGVKSIAVPITGIAKIKNTGDLKTRSKMYHRLVNSETILSLLGLEAGKFNRKDFCIYKCAISGSFVGEIHVDLMDSEDEFFKFMDHVYYISKK